MINVKYVSSEEYEVRCASAALRAFLRGNMGLVSEEVRLSPEYRAAKAAYAKAFAALRAVSVKRPSAT